MSLTEYFWRCAWLFFITLGAMSAGVFIWYALTGIKDINELSEQQDEFKSIKTK